METLVPLIIKALCGALGGITAGVLLKPISISIAGNILSGLVGGVFGAMVVDKLSGGMIPGYTADAIFGIICGAGLMIVIGILRKLRNS